MAFSRLSFAIQAPSADHFRTTRYILGTTTSSLRGMLRGRWSARGAVTQFAIVDNFSLPAAPSAKPQQPSICCSWHVLTKDLSIPYMWLPSSQSWRPSTSNFLSKHHHPSQHLQCDLQLPAGSCWTSCSRSSGSRNAKVKQSEAWRTYYGLWQSCHANRTPSWCIC